MALEKTKALRALKHLGKISTQFEFSFYVDRIENVPVAIDFIFSVKRGERLCSSSECRSVQLPYRSNGVVAFRELLILPVTLYMNKVGGEFLPKYAKLFLRRVGKAEEEPKTQGKLHLDLSKLIRDSSSHEDIVFQLSDGSKLFMTISWRSSKSNWTSDSKDPTFNALEKVVSESLYGTSRDISMEPFKLSSKDSHGFFANNRDLKEVKKQASERKHSLDNKTSRKPRQLKVLRAIDERNKSFDDSQAVRESILQKLMEENSLLRRHLVEVRSEMERYYLIELSQNAEISKLRAELRGFRETNQKACDFLETSQEMERIVVTNQELLEQFKKLEERYKSQVRSLFCNVYKLRELVKPLKLESCDQLGSSSKGLSVSHESIGNDKITSLYELEDSRTELRDNEDRDTQIHFLQKQFLLQREESANLLSELIRTKVSLALALENVEFLSFQNKKYSKPNKTDRSVPVWTKFLPWKFE